MSGPRESYLRTIGTAQQLRDHTREFGRALGAALTTAGLPAAQNDAWSFWGSMNERAATAWPLAIAAISRATGQPLESVRIFLDSCHGRHFADEVQNGLARGQDVHDAITAATAQWMDWRIGRHASKKYGIPRGLPYLTGFVIHCEILEESLAA